MTLFQSFLLGLIQGLTEFIPVSSTAHLLIGQQLLGLPSGEAMFSFLVLIQLGTVVSLILYFGRELWVLIRAFFARPFSTPENRLGWYILIATVPALAAGYLLQEHVKSLFQTPLLQASVRLFAAAALLGGVEWLGKRSRSLETMTWVDALLVGLFQILSIFPGASRSGTTIAGGMVRGFNRPAAARFAFLISGPVLLAAGLYQLLTIGRMPDLVAFLPALLVGFATAAVVGWLAVKWLIAYLGRRSLYVFAGYCAVLGVVLVFFQLS
ncbi:MAG: undecaprenyl-diphosphate phosphatase [Anaerolineales bacterium]|nr:undecaprenyl-diphosphate phosphatase [Anaerolineales bacterium]